MRWLVVVSLCLAFACKREEVVVLRFDDHLKDEIGERTTRAISSPQASAAFDAFMDAVAADPRVTQQGSRLADQLMSDTALAGALETIMIRMAESPQVMAALELLAQQNPDASEDEIGELFGQQFEVRWDSPTVSAAWITAWDGFVAKLGNSSELAALYRMITNAVISNDLDASIDRRINARLVEINGGKRPDSARAAALYLEHAWSEARISDAATKILANPTVRTATAKLVADLLAIDAVNAVLRKQSTTLATDPEVQSRVVRVLQALYAKDLDIKEVRVSLSELMTHAAVAAAVRDVLQVLAKSDRARALGGAWYEAVRKDTALVRDLRAFMTDW
jgi:hypothetical protein